MTQWIKFLRFDVGEGYGVKLHAINKIHKKQSFWYDFEGLEELQRLILRNTGLSTSNF